jgi:hypothetical protein
MDHGLNNFFGLGIGSRRVIKINDVVFHGKNLGRQELLPRLSFVLFSGRMMLHSQDNFESPGSDRIIEGKKRGGRGS